MLLTKNCGSRSSSAGRCPDNISNNTCGRRRGWVNVTAPDNRKPLLPPHRHRSVSTAAPVRHTSWIYCRIWKVRHLHTLLSPEMLHFMRYVQQILQCSCGIKKKITKGRTMHKKKLRFHVQVVQLCTSVVWTNLSRPLVSDFHAGCSFCFS